MRRTPAPLSFLLCAILGAAAITMVADARPAAAQADPRAQARDHYMAGKRLYDSGQYPQAIAEFTQADQLSASGINDFNIGLCYDKLGDAASAVKYYQSYLARVPDAANRATVEASITRLGDVVKKQEADAAAKKAADDAAAKKAADDAAAKKAADDAAAKAASDAAVKSGAGAPGGIVAPSPPANTGDPDLDRVAAVDVNAIRDQRGGGAPVPPAAGTSANASLGTSGGGAVGATGAVGQAGPVSSAPTQPAGPQPPEQPKQTPAYKKWWFWVIVGVGVIVAINLVSSPNPKTTTRGALLSDMPMPAPAQAGGFTIHF